MDKEIRKKYLEEQSNIVKLIATGMEMLQPDVGYVIHLDGLTIARDEFPEEYDGIR